MRNISPAIPCDTPLFVAAMFVTIPFQLIAVLLGQPF